MPRARHHIAALAAAAALLLLAVGPAALPSHQAMAADRGLVVVAQARYEALPNQRRVRVTIDAVATSYTPNPVDGLAFYPDVTFAVQVGAARVAASSGGRPLAVKVDASGQDFVNVTVTFEEGVFFQENYPYRVTYDLPDPGGKPDRNLRISPSIVAFPIWAFGTSGEPGGSVTVILPGGFKPTVQGDGLVASTGPNGEIVLSNASLPDPFAFFAYLSADRPGAFNDTLLTVEVGDKPAALKVRAWQDDPEWGTVMTKLMTDGLPALQRLIGLPYPAPSVLVVEEAATSRLGDYAGIYNKLTSSIRIRYDADAYVGLHEAAHVWFNGDLFRDRWIGEAYAEFYGVQAAKSIGATGSEFNLTDDLLTFQIPLNDWGEFGAVDARVEEYAYAASYQVAKLIFERTNVVGLQAVWQGADGAEMAYQPAHGSGTAQTGVDAHLEGWQELLDLLDQRAGANYDDLWSKWVVNDQQQVLLDLRAAARKHYDTVLVEAGAWDLPKDLRYQMGGWQFTQAEAGLTLADEVLAARDQIAAEATTLKLTTPAALRNTFQEDNGLVPARQEAMLEISTLAAISNAADRLGQDETFLETIGLLGTDPQADLDGARAGFEGDHLDAATREAGQALAARTGAESAGQTRVLLAGGGLFAVTGGSLVGLRIRRRRRAGARDADNAAPAEDSAATESPEPPAWTIDPSA
ncbi:MAG: hypothetical protein ABI578_03640 [Chloroflexota bacterium]